MIKHLGEIPDVFLHTCTQRKNVSKSCRVPGAGVEEQVIPLLDCAAPCRGTIPLCGAGYNLSIKPAFTVVIPLIAIDKLQKRIIL